MASPFFLAAGNSMTASDGLIFPDYPSGVTAGDLLLFVTAWKSYDVSTTTVSWTAPAGWTYLGELIHGDVTDLNGLLIFYKVADGSESGSGPLLELNPPPGATEHLAAGKIYAFQPENTPVVEDSNLTADNSPTIAWDDVTVADAERTLIAFAAYMNQHPAGSAPSGYTQVSQEDIDNPSSPIYMAFALNTKENVNAGVYDAEAGGGPSGGWLTAHISIHSYTPPPPVAKSRSFIVN